MIYTFKRVLLFISILWAFSGCHKEPVGPDINSLVNNYPDVKNLTFTVSRDTLNTPNQAIYGSAHFKNTVYWKLTFTGLRSGAKKSFSGIDSLITQLNTSWTGISDNPPLKFLNEDVQAVLSFPNAPSITYTKTFYIWGDGSHDKGTSVLVSDFHKLPSGAIWAQNVPVVPPNLWATAWDTDWQRAAIANSIPSPDKDGSYIYLQGSPYSPDPKSDTINSPYVTFLTISAPSRDGGSYNDLFFPNSPDPNQVYFNFYALNTVTTGINHAWLQIIFQENDGTAKVFTIKEPTWSGWKLFSIKYSDITLGDGISKVSGSPDRIKSIQFVLLSTQTVPIIKSKTPTLPVNIGIDHPIFTFGKPYSN